MDKYIMKVCKLDCGGKLAKRPMELGFGYGALGILLAMNERLSVYFMFESDFPHRFMTISGITIYYVTSLNGYPSEIAA